MIKTTPLSSNTGPGKQEEQEQEADDGHLEAQQPRSSSLNSKPLPIWLHQRSSRRFTLWTCSFSIFTDVFLYGLIVPVIPFALTDQIGIHEADVQHWTSILLSVFGAALIVGSPLAGWWADKVETRQVPFLVGLILLTGATVMLCLARSLPVLLIARVLQGLSGAVVWTVAMAITTDRVGPQNFGVSMGVMTVARSIAVFVGPILGGVVYAKAGYYAVYGTSFGFLVADIIFRFILIEARTAQRWDPSIGPEPEQPDIASADQDDRPSTEIESSGQTDRERGTLYRFAHRLPAFITLLGSVRLLVALWGCLLQAVAFGCFDAVIPIFVKKTFHWDSFGAGLVFLSLVIPTLLSPVFGWLADRHGPRWYVTGGIVLTAVPIILLRLVTHNSINHKVLLCALLALTGGISMSFEIPLWVEIVQAVELKGKQDPKQYGGNGAYAQAFGLTNMVWSLGLVVGPIWGGFIYEGAGWGTMNLTLGLLIGVSAIPSAIWIGGNIFDKSQASRSPPLKTDTVDDGGEKGVLRGGGMSDDPSANKEES